MPPSHPRPPERPEDAWVSPLNELLSAVDGPTLAPRLLRALHRVVPFDRGVLRVASRDGVRHVIYDSARIGAAHWLEPKPDDPEGGVDPCGPEAPGTLPCRVVDVRGRVVPGAGDDAPQLAFVTRLSDDTVLALILFCKQHEPSLDDEAMDRLARALPAVNAALVANWKLWGAASVPVELPRRDLAAEVRRAVLAFGSSELTPRERDVVRLLILGHSARRAGAALGIAEATVALHRKRAYAKLGVRSQGELFARFLRTLEPARNASR